MNNFTDENVDKFVCLFSETGLVLLGNYLNSGWRAACDPLGMKDFFKKGNNMKKAIYCLAAALAITASAYFVAQYSNSAGVTAQAGCSTPDCE